MACSAPADAQEFMECSDEIIQPILDVIYPILAVAITLSILFIGIRITRRVVKEFGKA